MTHRNWERSRLILASVNSGRKRKLGRIQAGVLESLLAHGTFPGTWYWSNASATAKTLQSLEKHGLVVSEEVDLTDWQGEPDPHGRKVVYFRPAPWMREVMDEDSPEKLAALLDKLGMDEHGIVAGK
jgi:hypothetical protein